MYMYSDLLMIRTYMLKTLANWDALNHNNIIIASCAHLLYIICVCKQLGAKYGLYSIDVLHALPILGLLAPLA